MTIFDNFTISASYMSMIMSETHISIANIKMIIVKQIKVRY